MVNSEELKVEETPITDIPEVVKRLRVGFSSHKTLDVSYRRTQLCNLRRLLEENKKEILDALWKDLRMSEMEAILIAHDFILGELNAALDNLDELTAPKQQPKDLLNKLNRVYVKPEPYGVVLIIAAWNLPFKLTLNPLIGVIAAGNCCLMKPSEVSVHFSTLLAKLIPKYLDQECYIMVNGGIDVSRAVLKERFDYIMYTGGTAVGRIVMKVAAENITPLTLELGGKNPVIIASDANLEVAGRRIIFGRFLNCGQMCIAPDLVICMSSQKDKLIEVFKKTLKEFFGEDPKESPDYGRIINKRHFKRLLGLLNSTSGDIVCGGDSNEATLYIAPTVIANVSPDDKIMQEEIFGPLLPIIMVESFDEAIKFVNEREKPLSMYVFTESVATFEKINHMTSAGGVCHNDTIMQAGVKSLPFGGVGHSGFGSYHGKHTFNTFSHYKSVLSTGTKLEVFNNIRYPPYDNTKLKRLKWLLTPSQKRSGLSWQLMYLFFLVAIAAMVFQIYVRGT